MINAKVYILYRENGFAITIEKVENKGESIF